MVAAFAATLVLTSCGGKLRPDNASISAIDAGYPTVEFQACGKVWNGVGVCKIKEGDLYDGVNLKIQGYGEGTGTIRVDAKNCELGDTFNYSKSQLVPIKINGRAGKNCLVTFVVAPKYKNQDKSGIVVYPLRGHLAIKVVRDQDDWEGYTLKRTGSWIYNYKVWIGGEGSVRVKMTGCGNTFDQDLPLVQGEVTIPVHRATSYNNVQTCVIEGIVVSPKYQDLFFTFVLVQYSGRYAVIPKPIMEVKGSKVTIKADANVSVVSIGNEYVLSNEADFKFDSSKPVMARALTVKGRNIIGQWNPKNKEWVWIQ